MLKGNLATRPFYNERLVTIAFIAVAVVAVLASIFNARAVVSLSAERSKLQAAIGRDEQQAAEIRRQAKALQQTVDRDDLKTLAAETREANTLIDARTFSWTTLLGLLETRLPIDVRLNAIFPKIDKDYIEVTLTLTARKQSDIETFIAKLEDGGVFYDVLKREDERNDDGTYNATVEVYYLEPTTAAAAIAKTGKGTRP